MKYGAHPPQWSTPRERRRKARIQDEIAARVWGPGMQGKRFNVDAKLENLSACGLYVRLNFPAKVGESLSASFRLPATPESRQMGTIWKTQGVIRRVEARADGAYGFGVEFTGYQEM